ncbi:MAG: transporter substrate-binding domain-containing protein [Treponema sp.]|jgi:PAS domain S-box-containing protein|nr:transporter substrate-binding domain-containing protein [Treponema sp.]
MNNEKLAKKKTRNKLILFICCSLLILHCSFVLSCGKGGSAVGLQNAEPPFASFRDVPGVTAQEIAAIEALGERYSHFVYGLDHTSEAFPVHMGQDNEIGGYAARLCGWLSDLFGIPFIPSLYIDDWHNLLAEFENGNVHFMGDLMPTAERRETHFMTGTISERSLTAFQAAGASPITEIAKSRPPRLAFPREYVLHAHTVETAEYAFESVFADNYAHAYRMIASGEADAFITMHTAEPMLARYGDVVSETFFPLVFASASLSTRKAELKPIISVVEKALENGAMPHLAGLHAQGNYDYLRNELFKQLTDEELDYIRSNHVVKIAAETANYPISFYNDNEDKFQGIAFDILSELETITGLSFEIADTRHRSFISGADMVERGEVSMITELGTFKENKGRFLWPQTPIMKDHSILISKSEFPEVHFNELGNVNVGMVTGTGHAALFKGWFPNNTGYMEYDNSDSAFNALKRGEIDILLSRANYLLSLENYKKIAGYRANTVLNNYFNCFFGFNKEEALLCGIVDKALQLINLETISGIWTHKTFDYRAKVAEVRLPWLIGAASLSLVVLTLILIMFYRSRNEEKRLAKLVKEETATISAILEATPDHLFCKDINRRFTRCNKKFSDYHNIRSADILGKTEEDVFGEPSELTTSLSAIENKIFNEKTMHIKDNKVPAPDGSVHLFETIRAPLILDEKVIGLVGLGRDITMRKTAEEDARKSSAEAMKAYAQAEYATKAKSRFIANMSHEMRNPMNVIIGLTGLLLEEENTPDKTKDTLEKINTAGNTLMGLISNVLDISKVESGKMELIPVQYDVPSLLNDVITLNIIHLEDKPITFKLDIDENLPLMLFGDDIRIKQILNNLLSNSFKYTKRGRITLSANCSKDKVGVWLSFCVSDTGIGIHKEDMPKLFSDYNQVDVSAHRGIQGTGLGLSITKKIVELMDGGISVESEYGKGSAFRVRIRQGFVSSRTIGKETAGNLRTFRYTDKEKQGHEKLERADLSYARVLVVDDFPTNLDVAAGMLRKYKMHVDCVMSGQEAVDRIAIGAPAYDAIFMDHMMPGMDGIEATAAIRALNTNYAKNIAIIALTANAVAESEKMFLENGFDAFLPKPFNTMSLDSVVQRWVRDLTKEQG